MHIFTHRGLEPSNPGFYPESSYEAFADQLERGFSIEFDPNFVLDGIVVSHDANLKRITEGKDTRNFSDIRVEEIKKIRYGASKKGRIPTFDEILQLIGKSKASLHALHLKGKYQTEQYMMRLLEHLQRYPLILSKILIFDLKPESARFIQSKEKRLHLAPSVAHSFDIKRYNSVVGDTLISVEDALKYKKEGLYDWVWLDEWDTADDGGKEKKLYTHEIFHELKKAGYFLALVTPELHGTSPGLYGGESHKDAKDKETLFQRIQEILDLEPDGICTDYPKEVKRVVENH